LKDTKTDDARFLAQWTTEEENALREGVKRCVCARARSRADRRVGDVEEVRRLTRECFFRVAQVRAGQMANDTKGCGVESNLTPSIERGFKG
jgi:hypothetical protein